MSFCMGADNVICCSWQVGDIWYTADGQCYDEMNRNLWMVLLNGIMQTVDGSWPLPGGGSSSSPDSGELPSGHGHNVLDAKGG